MWALAFIDMAKLMCSVSVLLNFFNKIALDNVFQSKDSATLKSLVLITLDNMVIA